MEETAESAGPVGRTSVAFALASVAILMVNVGLVVIDVLMRGLLSMPQSWVSDIAELTYPVAIACCFPIALHTGSMIVIRTLGGFGRIGWVLDCIGQVALLGLVGLFAWKVFWRGLSDWQTGYQTLTMKLPIAPSWLLVAAILAISAAVQAQRTLAILKGTTDAV